MNSKAAVEVAYDLIETEYELLGQQGYMATELQDGTILAAEYRNETRFEGVAGTELQTEFELTPLWGAHPNMVRNWAEKFGIKES